MYIYGRLDDGGWHSRWIGMHKMLSWVIDWWDGRMGGKSLSVNNAPSPNNKEFGFPRIPNQMLNKCLTIISSLPWILWRLSWPYCIKSNTNQTLVYESLRNKIWDQFNFSLKEAESAQCASSMCLLFHWPPLNVDTTTAGWLTFSHSSSFSYLGADITWPFRTPRSFIAELHEPGPLLIFMIGSVGL